MSTLEDKIKKRKEEFDKMKKSVSFNKKIIIIGYGAIGKMLLETVFRIINISNKNIYIIEKDEKKLKNIKRYNVNVVVGTMNNTNYKNILIDMIKSEKDDIILDASYNIDTKDLFLLCHEYGISYINSSYETWNLPSTNDEITYHQRFMSISELNKTHLKTNNFIVSMGCNPGNVNIWTLYALKKINSKTHNYPFTGYADLAQKLGLNVVHISEKDTQITNKPRKQFEYVNTWSEDSVSWYGEAFKVAEISWGTHEKDLPKNIDKALCNEIQTVLNLNGSDVFMYSYTPVTKNIIGMLISHDECYSICNKLTLRDDKNNIIYKPSCYYVYKPCDASFMSLIEVKENYNTFQKKTRLMTSDIVDGRDELGCTLFFQNLDIYWVGSLLDINEARSLYDNEHNDNINATITQVIAGYTGGLLYLIECINNKIYNGLLFPEDLPVQKIIKWTKPMLGPFGLIKIDDWEVEVKDKTKPWQFNEFTYEI